MPTTCTSFQQLSSQSGVSIAVIRQITEHLRLNLPSEGMIPAESVELVKAVAQKVKLDSMGVVAAIAAVQADLQAQAQPKTQPSPSGATPPTGTAAPGGVNFNMPAPSVQGAVDHATQFNRTGEQFALIAGALETIRLEQARAEGSVLLTQAANSYLNHPHAQDFLNCPGLMQATEQYLSAAVSEGYPSIDTSTEDGQLVMAHLQLLPADPGLALLTLQLVMAKQSTWKAFTGGVSPVDYNEGSAPTFSLGNGSSPFAAALKQVQASTGRALSPASVNPRNLLPQGQ